ncbi:hypothetical protein P3T73_00940 [Kiritimatiellota bacterium B12222]|nr:hypothetical protein P3T73_00940 [Kiritimatiellota bacterium B12222]
MTIFFEILIEVVLNALWMCFPGKKEQEGLEHLLKWREGKLSSHDETLIDSDRNYLLIATADGLQLVHRHQKWRGCLDETAESLYVKQGSRSFRRIHRHLLKQQKKKCKTSYPS